MIISNHPGMLITVMGWHIYIARTIIIGCSNDFYIFMGYIDKNLLKDWNG
jgi:hypothetical protein